MEGEPTGSIDEIPIEDYKEQLAIYSGPERNINIIDNDGDDIAIERQKYCRAYNPNHPGFAKFFSTHKPDVLLGAFINFLDGQQLEFKLSPSRYEATVQISSEHENIVDFSVSVQKVLKNYDSVEFEDSDTEDEDEDIEREEENEEDEDEDQIYCIELRKKKGPKADFLDS